MEFENCCDVAWEKLSSSFTFKSFISSFKLSIEYWIDWIEIESDLEIFLKGKIKVKSRLYEVNVGQTHLLLSKLPFSDETDWIFCLIIICCIGTFSSGKYAWHPLSSLITSSAFKTEWQTLGALWNLNDDFEVSYEGFTNAFACQIVSSHKYDSYCMTYTLWLRSM